MFDLQMGQWSYIENKKIKNYTRSTISENPFFTKTWTKTKQKKITEDSLSKWNLVLQCFRLTFAVFLCTTLYCWVQIRTDKNNLYCCDRSPHGFRLLKHQRLCRLHNITWECQASLAFYSRSILRCKIRTEETETRVHKNTLLCCINNIKEIS